MIGESADVTYTITVVRTYDGTDPANATDASASITDVMTLPDGWVSDPASNGPWTVTGDQTISYVVKFTNDHSDYGVLASITNVATLVTVDSATTMTAEAAVATSTELREDFYPEITMTKTATAFGVDDDGFPYTNVGGTIVWDVVIENTGMIGLVNLVFTDDMLGWSETLPSLAVGETWTLTTTSASTEVGMITNSAMVTADAEFAAGAVMASGEASVMIIDDPMLTYVESDCLVVDLDVYPEVAYPGDEITWYYSIYNCIYPGEGPCFANLEISDVTFWMDNSQVVFDLRSGDMIPGTDLMVPWCIYPGEWFNFTTTWTVPIWWTHCDYGDWLRDSFLVKTCCGGQVIGATDEVSVNILDYCSLYVTKSADVSVASPGDTITYTVTVYNLGINQLCNVKVWDTLLNDFLDFECNLLPCESQTLTYTWTVPEDWCYCDGPDYVINEVLATANCCLSEIGLEYSASCLVNIEYPCMLEIEKWADVSEAWANPMYGNNLITYYITVMNCGPCPITCIHVTDEMLGLDDWICELMPCEYQEYTFQIAVPSDWSYCDDGDYLTNTAAASGYACGQPVGDEETVSILIHDPWHLDVEKTAPETAITGETIVFGITVKNLGSESLHDVDVSDFLSVWCDMTQQYLVYQYIWDTVSTDQTIECLSPCESVTFEIEYIVMDFCCVMGLQMYNTAEADAWDAGLLIEAADMSYTYVEPPCDIAVEMIGPSHVDPGEEVTFQIVVSNVGETPLLDVCVKYWIEDSGIVGLSQPMPEMIKLASLPMLDVGEVVTYEVTYTVPEGDERGCFGYSIPYGAYVCGECYCADCVECGDNMLDEASSMNSMWVHPCCDVVLDITGPDEAVPGETIEYTITVTNTGLCLMTCLEVTDELTGFYQYVAELPAGESLSWVISYTVPEDWTYCEDGDELDNAAWATFCCCNCEAKLTAYSEWMTYIDDPVSFIVEKEWYLYSSSSIVIDDARPMPGDTILYIITVSELGYLPLSCVNVYDPTIGWYANIPVLCECNSITFEVWYTIPDDWNYCDDGEWLINTVYADAWACDEQVFAEDTEEVLLNVDHIIVVDKVGPETASPGEIITYDITVRNVGKLPLCNVNIMDMVSNHACWEDDELREFVYEIANLWIDCLDPCESYTFTASFEVPSDWTCMNGDDLFNWVVVVANGCFPCETLMDFDMWETEIINIPCTIEIAKTGPERAVPGETITYVITVTNPNCMALQCVFVVDETIGLNEYICCIEPFQTVVIEHEYTVPADWSYCEDGEYLTNVVTATSTCCTLTLAAEDVWTTFIDDPVDLRITKTADVSEAAPGDVVTYTIVVWNAGSGTLSSVCVRDDMLGLYDMIEVLCPCESKTYTLTYTISEDWTHCEYGDVLDNTVYACAVGCDLQDASAEATVIIPLDVDVSVRIWKYEEFDWTNIRPGDVLTWEYEVRNTGILPLSGIHAMDTVSFELGGEIIEMTILDETICCLDSCTSVYLHASFTVPDDWCCDVLLLDTHSVKACALVPEDGTYVTETTSYEDTHEYLVYGLGQLLVEKIGPEEVFADEPIPYSITVTNVGSVTLYCVQLVDGDNSWSWTELVPGASVTVTYIDYQTLECNGTEFSVTNTAVATATCQPCPCDDDCNGCVTASDSWTVEIEPILAIDLDVIVSGSCLPGETVFFDVTVTNEGKMNYAGFHLTDELMGLDITTNGVYAPGGYWNMVFSYTIPEDWTYCDDGLYLLDTFEVETCVPCGSVCHWITDSEDIQWEVCGPWVDVEKVAFVDGVMVDTVRPGDLVTYQITVTNVGEHWLSCIWIVDEMMFQSWYVPCLAPCESVVFTFDYQVSPDWCCGMGDWLSNDVLVYGLWNGNGCCDPIQFTELEELDLAVCNPYHLMIWKDNDAGDFAVPGQLVTYTITVFNAGTECLTSVYVDDEMLGLHEMIPCLEPCTWMTYTVGYVVPEDWSYCEDGEYIENMAVATALYMCDVSDECKILTVNATNFVYIFDPCDVRVTIIAPSEAGHGDTVEYTVIVSNVGSNTACGLRVYDEVLGLDEIVWCLQPCESVTFTVTLVVPPCDIDDPLRSIDNTVIVCGCCCAPMCFSDNVPTDFDGQMPPCGCCHVFAEASWSVLVACTCCLA
ncbi:MAG: hypothetical protein A4E32_01321 [Methanomassiliicoccales archaeon PtaU1.Bin124]|nr:MAG: hypothetical protein A4E32_01321 [Methanomassiliicoccales archaeon PtaU1.Bin124]